MTASQLGRRSSANELRLDSCLSIVIEQLGIELNGSELANAVCGTNARAAVRSGKYTKILNNKTILNSSTIDEVDGAAPGFKVRYRNIVWRVLNHIEHPTEQHSLYEQLDPAVYPYICLPSRNEDGQLQIKRKLSSSILKKIYRATSLSALATLILLRFEHLNRFRRSTRSAIDPLIYDSIVNLRILRQLGSNYDQIFELVAESFWSNSHSNDYEPFIDSPKSITAICLRREKIFEQFKKFVWYPQPEPLMHKVLALIADSDEILLEQELAISNQLFVKKEYADADQRGLIWAQENLNSYVAHKDHVKFGIW